MIEPRKSLVEFTEQEKMAINRLHRDEFKNASAEDVKLYAEWEATVAVDNDRCSATRDALMQATAASAEKNEHEKELAFARLKAHKDQAFLRLRAANAGKGQKALDDEYDYNMHANKRYIVDGELIDLYACETGRKPLDVCLEFNVYEVTNGETKQK